MTTHETQSTHQEFIIERMDLRGTAKVLGAMVGYLEAEEAVRIAQGAKDESEILTLVRQEHERLATLIESSEPGIREVYLDQHQPSLDVLDVIYDCNGDDCPAVGYKSGEDRAFHHRMWGFDNPLIDVRNLPE